VGHSGAIRAAAWRGGAVIAAGAGRQRGVALISVLLIVALVGALVYHLITQHALAIARTQQTTGISQSLQYVLGAEAFARQILAEKLELPDGRTADHLGEAWAQPLAPFEVEGGHLELDIVDLQASFNLNALAGSDVTAQHARLQQLLNALNVDVRIADLWRDWIDSDDTVTGLGAEDGDYLLQEPPYRTANRPAGSATELRALLAVEQEDIGVLLPHVVALPTTALRVNVNTATAATLAALSPQLTLERAEAIADMPRQYTDIVSAVAEFPELTPAQGVLSVTSAFFRINAMAEIDGVRVELVSIVHRDPEDGSIRLISRDFGRRYVSRVVDQ
jgi:general secretion pathway protein K